MGYDLHITRRRRWADPGPHIAAFEWLALVKADPELRLDPDSGPCFAVWTDPAGGGDGWLDWVCGRIESKNPPPPLVAKMVAIARALDAQVQGDDDEVYESAEAPPVPYRPSFSERLGAFLSRLRRPRLRPVEPPPFRVGDRVVDALGREGDVVAVDATAAHGIGSITVRLDAGPQLTLALAAHGLRPRRP